MVAGAPFDADTDGDGLSDWGEVRAGTGPIDRESVLSLVNAGVEADDRLAVTWHSIRGRGYRIEYTTDLVSSPWRVWGTVVEAGTSGIERGVGLPHGGLRIAELSGIRPAVRHLL